MRVVTVTPAGRKPYLEILAHYLLQNRAHIAEHHFWVNTTTASDIAYLESLATAHPDFFKLVRRPVFDNTQIHLSIWHYFQDYVLDDTIYIRLDDDICYIAPNAIPNIVAFRTAHRAPFLILGNIVNNAICSYYQQQRGKLPLQWGLVGNTCMDRVGWMDRRFAQRLHAKFLDDLYAQDVASWKMPSQSLGDYRRFSINAICWFGHDMRQVSELTIPNLDTQRVKHPLTGAEMYDEEAMLTEYLPAKMQRANLLCGDAVFGHFAYYPQRHYLETATPFLQEYRALCFPETRDSVSARKLKRALKPFNILTSPYTRAYIGKRLRKRQQPNDFAI